MGNTPAGQAAKKRTYILGEKKEKSSFKGGGGLKKKNGNGNREHTRK